MFPDREEILAMRVAEEANLRSDLHDFKCTWPRFTVIAHHSERLGWHVSPSPTFVNVMILVHPPSLTSTLNLRN